MDMETETGGLLGVIATAIIFLIPLWKIVSKAGYHGAWSLLSLVPFVNIAALWLFAFKRWPGQSEPPSLPPAR